jgi:hypothetical protein
VVAQTGMTSAPEGANTWLLVDCLPALPILQGAVGTLARCSVVCVRALLQPVAGITGGATLQELDSFLHGHGFKRVDVQESLQPAVGHALYVRDWAQAQRAQAERGRGST